MLKVPQAGSRILIAGHHDLDGVVSSAMAGAWLQSVVPSCDIEYAIVDFDLGSQWKSIWEALSEGRRPWNPGVCAPQPDMVAVVDFPAPIMTPERIALYADHHPASFDADTAVSYVRARQGGSPVFHEICGSCARLLVERLYEETGWVPVGPLAEAARLAHLVDTAGYATVAEALSFNSAGPAAYAYWIETRSSSQAALIAKRLAAGATLTGAVIDGDILEFEATLEQARLDMAALDTHTGRVSHEVLVLDQTSANHVVKNPMAFAEYQDPEIRYAVKLVYAEDGVPLVLGSLGRSPWAPQPPEGKRNPNLGLIASTFASGGGHPYAAGFRVEGRTLKDAARRARVLVQEMLPYLKLLPPGHRFAADDKLH